MAAARARARQAGNRCVDTLRTPRVAIAIAVIQRTGWTEVTPGAIALLVGATGIGNLAYFVLARRLD